MGIKAKIGDLFMIPLDQDAFGLGLVAGKWKDELYLIVFRDKFHQKSDLSEIPIESLSPLLASSSLDAKIWHGHWPIIRENVNVSCFSQPIYKIDEPNGIMAETFDRKSRWEIDSDVVSRLRYRKTVAPIRLENAFKASSGVSVWEPIFDELLYENVVRGGPELSF